MSLSVAPLTHRATLTRQPCPICRADTLHAHGLCIHCHHSCLPPQKPKKPAFGARLVLNTRHDFGMVKHRAREKI